MWGRGKVFGLNDHRASKTGTEDFIVMVGCNALISKPNQSHGTCSKSLTQKTWLAENCSKSFGSPSGVSHTSTGCCLVRQLGRHFHGLPTWHQCKHQPEHTLMFSLEYEKYSRKTRKAHGFSSEFHVNSRKPSQKRSCKEVPAIPSISSITKPPNSLQQTFPELPWPHPL